VADYTDSEQGQYEAEKAAYDDAVEQRDRSALSPAQPQPQGAAGYAPQRYSLEQSYDSPGTWDMEPRANGAYILHADHESALSSAQARVEHVSARLVSVEAERAALSKDVARLVGERDEYRDLLQSWKDAAARHAEQTAEILGLREERDRERAARELTEAERETFKQGWQGAEDRISELHRERDQERAAMRERVKDLMPAVIVVEALHIQDQRQPYRELSPEMRDELPKAVAGLRAFFSALPAAPAIAPPPAEQETPQ
jgi:uncharacterized protein YecA (UPF0149 family)